MFPTTKNKRKRLPPELLYELIVYIYPTPFSGIWNSSWILREFLVPRVVRWKEIMKTQMWANLRHSFFMCVLTIAWLNLTRASAQNPFVHEFVDFLYILFQEENLYESICITEKGNAFTITVEEKRKQLRNLYIATATTTEWLAFIAAAATNPAARQFAQDLDDFFNVDDGYATVSLNPAVEEFPPLSDVPSSSRSQLLSSPSLPQQHTFDRNEFAGESSRSNFLPSSSRPLHGGRPKILPPKPPLPSPMPPLVPSHQCENVDMTAKKIDGNGTATNTTKTEKSHSASKIPVSTGKRNAGSSAQKLEQKQSTSAGPTHSVRNLTPSTEKLTSKIPAPKFHSPKKADECNETPSTSAGPTHSVRNLTPSTKKLRPKIPSPKFHSPEKADECDEMPSTSAGTTHSVPDLTPSTKKLTGKIPTPQIPTRKKPKETPKKTTNNRVQ